MELDEPDYMDSSPDAEPHRHHRGDPDGNGRDEVVFNFTGAGTWVWWNNASWSLLHALNPTLMTSADLDDSGHDDLVLDFPGAGNLDYANAASWTDCTP